MSEREIAKITPPGKCVARMSVIDKNNGQFAYSIDCPRSCFKPLKMPIDAQDQSTARSKGLASIEIWNTSLRLGNCKENE